MNIVLIVILFILIFSALQGWRKGILGVVYGLASWLFIFIFVSAANPYALDYLKKDAGIYEKVYQRTEEFVAERSNNVASNAGVGEWYQSITDDVPQTVARQMSEALEKMQGTTQENSQLQQLIFGMQSGGGETLSQYGGADGILQLSNGTQTVGQIISIQITEFVLQGLAVFITYVVAQIIVCIVGMFVRGARRLPGVGQLDGLLGLAIGTVEGFIIAWILMYVAACISTTDLGQGIMVGIRQSAFLTYLYEHNLVMAMLMAL